MERLLFDLGIFLNVSTIMLGVKGPCPANRDAIHRKSLTMSTIARAGRRPVEIGADTDMDGLKRLASSEAASPAFDRESH
jgi:hypothetical protein